MIPSSSSMIPSSSSMSFTTTKKYKNTYESLIGFDENASISNCIIGILDIPTKTLLSQEFNIYNKSNIIHIGWQQFEYNSDIICKCNNLYIRITRTYAQMVSQILGDASDAIFIFAAWYPTIKQRRVYIKLDQSATFKSSSLIIKHNNYNINIPTYKPTNKPTNKPTIMIQETEKGSIICILFGSIILLCILCIFIQKKLSKPQLRGVSLQIRRHPIIEKSINNNNNNNKEFIVDETNEMNIF